MNDPTYLTTGLYAIKGYIVQNPARLLGIGHLSHRGDSIFGGLMLVEKYDGRLRWMLWRGRWHDLIEPEQDSGGSGLPYPPLYP